MKYMLMILLGVFGPFCFGYSVKVKDVNVRIMKFLCDSGEKESLCEPVQRLMEAKKQYDSALASEEWKELSERLERSYDSEVAPFLRDLCNVGTSPTYMITVCEVLSILNEAEQKLHDETNARVLGFDARQIQQMIIEATKREVREAQKNYEVMKGIAIEIVCDRKEGPKAFCDLLEEFRIHEEENLYKAEVELRNAKTALKSQADVICKVEKGKKRSRLHRLHLKVLCGD